MVSPAEEPRASDPRSSPRGGPPGPDGGDIGACAGRPRGAPRTLYGGRPVAVSGGPRAVLPNSGVEPPQDHEEGSIEEATAGTACRPGAPLSGIAVILALLRIVEKIRSVPHP